MSPELGGGGALVPACCVPGAGRLSALSLTLQSVLTGVLALTAF